MNRLLIVGAGGFGREALAWAQDIPQEDRGWEVGGFLDGNPDALKGYDVSYRVVGDPESYQPLPHDRMVCAIAKSTVRLEVCQRLVSRGGTFVSLIHPTATVGPRCRIGAGSILCPGVVVTTDVSLGEHVILNVNATVGHDVVIDDGCTLSGHTDVTGFARLGRGVLLGTHATVLPGVVVEEFATVGAGSAAYRRVRRNTTVVGIPAKRVH